MRVSVYKNLNDGCWSVVALEGAHKDKVIIHTDYVRILEPEFVVNPAGQRRARHEGVKNVHAYVNGLLAAIGPDAYFRRGPVNGLDENEYVEPNHQGVMPEHSYRFTYNPFKYDSFVVLHGEKAYPVESGFVAEFGEQTRVYQPKYASVAPTGRAAVL